MKHTHIWRTLPLLGLLSFAACERSETPASAPTATPAVSRATDDDIAKASAALAELSVNSLGASLDLADQLRASVRDFLDQPSADTLLLAQQRWRACLLGYRRFFLLQQLGLVEPAIFAHLNRLDFQIASYPIQPGFLDSYGDHQYSGLVNDIGFPLNPESLTNQHGLTSNEDVVLGLYAIEFMLLGYQAPRDIADYQAQHQLSPEAVTAGYQAPEELPGNRRRQLLALQVELLHANIEVLRQDWQADSKDASRQKWLNLFPASQAQIARAALSGGLTQLMLEVGELGQAPANRTYTTISPAVAAFGPAEQYQFIGNGLSSLAEAARFLGGADRAQLSAHLETAIALLGDNTPAEGDAKALWSKVFAQLLAATELLQPAG